MSGNPLDANSDESALPATELRPADFPLHSVQSRAAARTLERMRRGSVSQGDVYPPGWFARQQKGQ